MSIIRFPIIIINNKASETQPGLVNTLQSTVRPLSAASTEYQVSEQGIREALNDIDFILSGQSIGTGFDVFNYVSGGIPTAAIPDQIAFNSISGMGVLNIYNDSNYIYLDSIQYPLTQSEEILVTSGRTLNGGIEQEASRINWANFETLSSIEAYHNVQAGDVIGKFVIKCSEPFTNNGGITEFSIGTSALTEGFVEKFTAPTTTGLVSINYGLLMYDKVEYTNLSGLNINQLNNLVAGDNIYVYQYGDKPTSGEMQCVIFYDKLLYNALFAGGANNDNAVNLKEITQLQMTNETCSNILTKLITGRCACANLGNSSYIWFAGGQKFRTSYSLTDLLSNCERLTKDVITISVISNSMIQSKMFLKTGSTNSIGYIFGGQIDIGTVIDTIEKFTYSTEVFADTTANLLATNCDEGVVTILNNQYIYIGGGWNTSTSFTNMVQRYDTSSETTNTVDRMDLVDNIAHLTARGNGTYGYFIGGYTSSISSDRNIIQRMTYSSDTTNCVSRSTLVIPRYVLGSVSSLNYNDIYIAGGYSISLDNDVNIVEKYSTLTDTMATIIKCNLPTAKRSIEGITI